MKSPHSIAQKGEKSKKSKFKSNSSPEPLPVDEVDPHLVEVIKAHVLLHHRQPTEQGTDVRVRCHGED